MSIGFSRLRPALLICLTVTAAGAARAVPGTIGDLVAGQSSSASLTVTFTGPGDNGKSGTPAGYVIRTSTAPITPDNFAQATEIAGEPNPVAPGSKVSVTVGGLDPLQNYYVAAEAMDENMQAGALSNVVMAETAAPAGSGDGLLGKYYPWDSNTINGKTPFNDGNDQTNWNKAELTRVDGPVDFSWNSGGPDPSLFGDQYYSVRWTGQVTAEDAGDYLFGIGVDDGGRLWANTQKPPDPVNDTPDIDSWKDEGTTEVDSQPVTLTAGQKAWIDFDYYQNSGHAEAHLYWTPPNGLREIIPAYDLISGTGMSQQYGRLDGLVTNQLGKPFSGATVTLDSQQATTDANGFYTFMAPAGPHALSLQAVAFIAAGGPQTVTVAAGKLTNAQPITASAPPFFESSTTGPYDDEFMATKLDPKWTDVDIGDSTGGSATPDGKGVLDLMAGGHDVWSNMDGLNFAYQTVKGDFAATVEVAAQPDNRVWEKTGLMARASTAAGSANAFDQVSSQRNIQNAIRPTNGGQTSNVDTGSGIGTMVVPVWLKIRRVGDQVVFYWTEDPKTGPVHMTSVRAVPAFDHNDLLVGLAATSHMMGTTDDGFQFSHFKVASLTPATSALVCGDLNADGKVSVPDATIALRIAIGLATADAANTGGACGHAINVAFATQILHAAIFGNAIAPQM